MKFWNWLLVIAVLPTIAACQRGNANAPATPAAELAELPTDEQLEEMLNAALGFTYNERHLNLDQHAAWQILHGALPYGRHFKVYNGDQRVGAIDWVIEGNQMKGWTVRHGQENLPHGRRGLKMVLESGSKAGQGHEDQWLAVLSQSGLKLEDKVIFQGQDYIMEDIVQQVMYDVYEGKECSWTLIALTNYLEDFGTEWTCSDGKTWTVERMIEMEANQDVNESACGGTHRLIGMTMTLARHLREGGKVEGGWLAARDKIEDAILTSRAHQQPDGTLSTNYFLRAGTSPDLALRINTTGHTVEFLSMALDSDFLTAAWTPEELQKLKLTSDELQSPWIVRAVAQLCDLFDKTKSVNLECGSLYHATHGLIEYYERRFGLWQYPDAVAEDSNDGVDDPDGDELADK